MYKFDEKDWKKYLDASGFFEKYPNLHIDENFFISSKLFYEDFGYYIPMGKFRNLKEDYEVRIEKFEPLKYHMNREFREKDYYDYVDRRIPGYSPKITRKKKKFVEDAKKCFEKYQRYSPGTPVDSFSGHAELHELQEKSTKEEFYNK